MIRILTDPDEILQVRQAARDLYVHMCKQKYSDPIYIPSNTILEKWWPGTK